jgi:hypothetical protein
MMKCACCGGDMKPDKDTGNSIIYKCSECGLSDSRLKEEGGEEKSLGYTRAILSLSARSRDLIEETEEDDDG